MEDDIKKKKRKIRIIQWSLFIGSFIMLPVNKWLTDLAKQVELIPMNENGIYEANWFFFVWFFYVLAVSPPFVLMFNIAFLSPRTPLTKEETVEAEKFPTAVRFRFTPEQRETIARVIGVWSEENPYGTEKDIRDWIGRTVYRELHQYEEYHLCKIETISK